MYEGGTRETDGGNVVSVTSGPTVPSRDTPVETVLFDLDDTLCEHPVPYEDRLADAFDRAGVDPYFDAVDVRRAASEVDARDPRDFREQSFAVVAESYDRDPAEARVVARAFEGFEPTEVVPRDGAREVVEAFADRFTLGIVTNTTPTAMRTKLDAIGLANHFDVCVAPGETHAPKPDPAMFEQVIGQLDISRARTVHIGNSTVSDVAGARAAGLRTVWVPTDRDGGGGPEPTWHRRELGSLTAPPWS